MSYSAAQSRDEKHPRGKCQPLPLPGRAGATLRRALQLWQREPGQLTRPGVFPGLPRTRELRFWEYQSTDLAGTNHVDVSQRPSWSKQLTAAEAASVRDPATWFGGWVPQVTP